VRSSRKLGIVGSLVAIGTGLFLAGCPTATTFTPPVLPTEIASVVQNYLSVALQANDPFAQIEPGTVEDALSNLDGCWALYRQVLADGSDAQVPAGTPLVDSYEFYHFDAATTVAQYQEYNKAVSTETAFYVSLTGHYTLVDNSQVQVIWDAAAYSDPTTGEVTTHTYTAAEKADQPGSKVTIRGNQLRIKVESTTVTTDERVYTRYTCP
jgi:hypothetical protein